MILIEKPEPARDYAEPIRTNYLDLPMAVRAEPHPMLGAAAMLAMGLLIGAVLFS